MSTCPKGHSSSTDDYCDECGAPMPDTPSSTEYGTLPATAGTHEGAARCPAPGCGEPRVGRFCEACGHDFVRSDRGAWAVVVHTDRRRRGKHALVTGGWRTLLSAPAAQRRFTLAGSRIVIGRQSRSRGIMPDIDLSGWRADPYVSHVHAYLVAQPNGTWSVVDRGSANGTTLNEATDRLAPEKEFPLRDGDRIHLGAWTTIVIYYED